MKSVMVWVRAKNLYSPSKASPLRIYLASAWLNDQRKSFIFQKKLNWVFQWSNMNKWTNQQSFHLQVSSYQNPFVPNNPETVIRHAAVFGNYEEVKLLTAFAEAVWIWAFSAMLEQSPQGNVAVFCLLYSCSCFCRFAALQQLHWWLF